MARMKTDVELRRIISRICKAHDVNLVRITRNIQLSVDVELDEFNNLYYKDMNALEAEIRAIKGVVINDIFTAGIPHT